MATQYKGNILCRLKTPLITLVVFSRKQLFLELAFSQILLSHTLQGGKSIYTYLRLLLSSESVHRGF